MSRYSLQRPEKDGRRSVKLGPCVNLQTGGDDLPKAALGFAAIVSVTLLLLRPLTRGESHKGDKRRIQTLHCACSMHKRLGSQ